MLSETIKIAYLANAKVTLDSFLEACVHVLRVCCPFPLFIPRFKVTLKLFLSNSNFTHA